MPRPVDQDRQGGRQRHRRLPALAALVITGVAASVAPAIAGDYLEDARISYAAVVEVRAGPAAYRGRLYHQPGMQRRVFEGQGRYQILRFDSGVAWSVDPAHRHWWPEGLSSAGLLSRAQVSLVQVGEARLLGRRARIYQVSGMVSSGARIKGRVWLDRTGILLRARLTWRFGKRRRSYHMQVLSLRVGPQPATLFSLPVAYRLRPTAARWNPAAGHQKHRGRKAARQHSLEDLFRR